MVLFFGRAAVFERTVPRRADRGAAAPGCRSRRRLDRSRARDTPSAVDSKKVFVQMPMIPELALSSLQFANIICAELLTPQPDCFVRYHDAAFRQKILDISEGEAETMVSPDRMTDDLGRKPIAGVAR